MTDEDLKAIEARANAATPGPWLFSRYPGDPPESFSAIGTKDQYNAICTTDSNVYGPCLADAEFIVHARDDIPALIAELRSLKAQLAAIRQPPVAMAEEVARLKELVRLREEEIGTQREMTLPMLEDAARKAEREACAKVAEETEKIMLRSGYSINIAAAIRERGEQDVNKGE